MIKYDKDKLKQTLTLENIFNLLTELGGEPIYTNFGLVSSTICHNPPGEGSRKLYYYENSHLFHCFTHCAEPSFDIIELVIKAKQIQEKVTYSFFQAMDYIAFKCQLSASFEINEETELFDWDLLERYKKNEELVISNYEDFKLKAIDSNILKHFSYPRIIPWEQENINDLIIKRNQIGYYPSDEQITIPHFDINGRLVGIRGRSLVKAEADQFGKYRPLYINGILYNHPLRYNLYNLHNSKNNIKIIKKAIIFEAEKSCLMYQSYFGIENDISVACCGSNISDYQIWLLRQLDVEEIIIAFDRQFQEIGDEEFQHLKKNILSLNAKYKKYCNLSFIWDKNMITDYKASPIDNGKDKFLQLFKERIIL